MRPALKPWLACLVIPCLFADTAAAFSAPARVLRVSHNPFQTQAVVALLVETQWAHYFLSDGDLNRSERIKEIRSEIAIGLNLSDHFRVRRFLPIRKTPLSKRLMTGVAKMGRAFVRAAKREAIKAIDELSSPSRPEPRVLREAKQQAREQRAEERRLEKERGKQTTSELAEEQRKKARGEEAHRRAALVEQEQRHQAMASLIELIDFQLARVTTIMENEHLTEADLVTAEGFLNDVGIMLPELLPLSENRENYESRNSQVVQLRTRIAGTRKYLQRKAAEARQAAETVRANAYAQGDRLYNAGRYAEAYAAFGEAGEHADARERRVLALAALGRQESNVLGITEALARHEFRAIPKMAAQARGYEGLDVLLAYVPKRMWEVLRTDFEIIRSEAVDLAEQETMATAKATHNLRTALVYMLSAAVPIRESEEIAQATARVEHDVGKALPMLPADRRNAIAAVFINGKRPLHVIDLLRNRVHAPEAALLTDPAWVLNPEASDALVQLVLEEEIPDDRLEEGVMQILVRDAVVQRLPKVTFDDTELCTSLIQWLYRSAHITSVSIQEAKEHFPAQDLNHLLLANVLPTIFDQLPLPLCERISALLISADRKFSTIAAIDSYLHEQGDTEFVARRPYMGMVVLLESDVKESNVLLRTITLFAEAKKIDHAWSHYRSRRFEEVEGALNGVHAPQRTAIENLTQVRRDEISRQPIARVSPALEAWTRWLKTLLPAAEVENLRHRGPIKWLEQAVPYVRRQQAALEEYVLADARQADEVKEWLLYMTTVAEGADRPNSVHLLMTLRRSLFESGSGGSHDISRDVDPPRHRGDPSLLADPVSHSPTGLLFDNRNRRDTQRGAGIGAGPGAVRFHTEGRSSLSTFPKKSPPAEMPPIEDLRSALEDRSGIAIGPGVYTLVSIQEDVIRQFVEGDVLMTSCGYEIRMFPEHRLLDGHITHFSAQASIAQRFVYHSERGFGEIVKVIDSAPRQVTAKYLKDKQPYTLPAAELRYLASADDLAILLGDTNKKNDIVRHIRSHKLVPDHSESSGSFFDVQQLAMIRRKIAAGPKDGSSGRGSIGRRGGERHHHAHTPHSLGMGGLLAPFAEESVTRELHHAATLGMGIGSLRFHSGANRGRQKILAKEQMNRDYRVPVTAEELTETYTARHAMAQTFRAHTETHQTPWDSETGKAILKWFKSRHEEAVRLQSRLVTEISPTGLTRHLQRIAEEAASINTNTSHKQTVKTLDVITDHMKKILARSAPRETAREADPVIPEARPLVVKTVAAKVPQRKRGLRKLTDAQLTARFDAVLLVEAKRFLYNGTLARFSSDEDADAHWDQAESYFRDVLGRATNMHISMPTRRLLGITLVLRGKDAEAQKIWSGALQKIHEARKKTIVLKTNDFLLNEEARIEKLKTMNRESLLRVSLPPPSAARRFSRMRQISDSLFWTIFLTTAGLFGKAALSPVFTAPLTETTRSMDLFFFGLPQIYTAEISTLVIMALVFMVIKASASRLPGAQSGPLSRSA